MTVTAAEACILEVPHKQRPVERLQENICHTSREKLVGAHVQVYGQHSVCREIAEDHGLGVLNWVRDSRCGLRSRHRE